MSSIPVFFTTPAFAESLARLNINLIEFSAAEKLFAVISPSDIAFNFCLDSNVRQVLNFTEEKTGKPRLERMTGIQENPVYQNHVMPMVSNSGYQNEVFNYLNDQLNSSNIVGEQAPYRITALQGILIVGVAPGFFKQMSNKEAVTLFYRDCLEVCQASMPRDLVVHSELFGNFVKLSISF